MPVCRRTSRSVTCLRWARGPLRATCLLGLLVPASAIAERQPDILAAFGSFGSGAGQFQYPYGIAADRNGVLYVTDQWNHRVVKFSPTGAPMGTFASAGSGPGQLSQPIGIAIGPEGRVYVSEEGNRRVQVFTADGIHVRMIGGPPTGPGQLVAPRGVFVDPRGVVYVAVYGGVDKFSADGTLLQVWGTGFLHQPHGLAMDGSDAMIVTDIHLSRVHRYSLDGQLLATIAGYGQAVGQVWNPAGVAVDRYRDIYVTEWGNGRLQKFSSTGTPLSWWPVPSYAEAATAGVVDVEIDVNGRIAAVMLNANRIMVYGYPPTAAASTSWGRVKALYR